MLSLSSIEKESEVGVIDLKRHELNPIINGVVSLCREKASRKDIEIKLLGDNYCADINLPLFEQAIINLLDNAIKYAPGSSLIKVELLKLEDFIQVCVIDEGQGIEKKHHERLFERFYSVDKTRSREMGGSGLGLAIVKHIALSHNGNVHVKSEIGKGSTFIFELPLI